jgi:hypothetical protein
MQEEKKNFNLCILGLASIIIAVVTTGISIVIYHKSGDIYLDRSRPGFLPDEEEIEQPTIEEFNFSEAGPITQYDIDEYIKHYIENMNELDKIDAPFGAGPLSGKSLGIPEK